MLPILIAPLLTGCVVYESPFGMDLGADGVTTIVADIDRGSLDYRGFGASSMFDIEGVSQGTASSQAKAERKADGNDWQIDVEGAELEIITSSRENGRVHLDVDGPELMDSDLIVDSGSVYLEDVEGVHVITADRVETRDLVGAIDVYSHSGSVDIEIFPWDEGFVYIESYGSTTLRMPSGLDYDIEVWGDPEYSMSIEDLYFYDSYMGEGYFSAESGDRSVQVDVHVNGGTFTLRESW